MSVIGAHKMGPVDGPPVAAGGSAMILRWLADDFREVFDRNPEVRVVLWFDEKEELRRLLPQIGQALEAQAIEFLCFDSAESHGQLWLKWNIEAGPKAEAERVVLWLPFARELLHRGKGNEIHLEALLEYENSGKIWLVDGKKPTLFLFLRKHGVPLPDSRAEQDALWRGGQNSLLAKYAAKFVDRDEAFWRECVTPAVIERSLVGDLKEQVLLVLADPEGAAADLKRRGLLGEFKAQVRSEYRWERSLEADPRAWAADFAATAALCEIHDSTGRPEDFPFSGRLPERNARERWLLFVRDWMRSRDHEHTFRSWMVEAERAHDLSGWSGRLQGQPQAFRGLAAERWARWYREFGDVAESKTEFRTFLAGAREAIEVEAKGFWAQVAGVIPGWRLAARLADLASRCKEVLTVVSSKTTAAELIQAYAEDWYTIDLDYWMLLSGIRDAENVERLLSAADAFYGEYLEATSRHFHNLVRGVETWPPDGCPAVRDLAQTLWNVGPANRAVLVIDALRFDLGRTLAETTSEGEVRHLVGHLPSETFAGMSGLLSCADVKAEVSDRGRVRLLSDEAGGDLVQRQVRWRYLQSRFQAESLGGGDRPADLAMLLDCQSPPKPLPKLLVVMDKEIDGTAHATDQESLHHFDLLLEKLSKAVSKLLRWGYSEVHVVTDHGFVLLGSSLSCGSITMDKSAVAVSDARFALLKDGAVVDGAVLPLSLDPRHRLLMAPGLRSFKDPGRFFHGGATLQEVVIPHVVFRREVPRSRMRVRPLISETEIRTLTFKIQLMPEAPPRESLYDQEALPITVKVFLGAADAPRSTVKEVTIAPDEKLPVKALVHLQAPLDMGEEIDLHVVDAETDLEFAENLKVRVMREFR